MPHSKAVRPKAAAGINPKPKRTIGSAEASAGDIAAPNAPSEVNPEVSSDRLIRASLIAV